MASPAPALESLRKERRHDGEHHAVATWTADDYPAWGIDFPDGIAESGWDGTCTGSGKNTKRDAEFMAPDLVAAQFDYTIRRDDVKLSIKWRNEGQYRRWHERKFGVRESSR